MTRHRTDRAPNAAPPKPGVEADARDRLGHSLRLFYASVLNQPLPDRFTRLLDTLSNQGDQTHGRDREGSR